MSEEIQEKVLQVIARSQQLPVEQVKLDTAFEEIGMTSLDALSLIFDLEEEFNISIPNEEAMGLRTVKQAIESVRKLVTLAQPAPPEAGGELPQ